jgi:hypothetical protein
VTNPPLKDKYVLARCCSPTSGDVFLGYFSHDDIIKVHRRDCSSLKETDAARLVSLEWREIAADVPPAPEDDYHELDTVDFAILEHHRDYDIDYSLMVAGALRIPRQEAFSRHDKLRNLGLLERVDAVMVRYRKNIVPGKWIKHRNHTYYRLTQKGMNYLEHYLADRDR